MKKISKKKMKEIEKEVIKEFPEDYALQQVHLARLIIEEKTKDLTNKELIEFYKKYRKVIK